MVAIGIGQRTIHLQRMMPPCHVSRAVGTVPWLWQERKMGMIDQNWNIYKQTLHVPLSCLSFGEFAAWILMVFPLLFLGKLALSLSFCDVRKKCSVQSQGFNNLSCIIIPPKKKRATAHFYWCLGIQVLGLPFTKCAGHAVAWTGCDPCLVLQLPAAGEICCFFPCCRWWSQAQFEVHRGSKDSK